MPGLLDMFGNLSPEQNQGLLAAAAQILQNSGPSRQPFTIGNAMGVGIGAYQQSKRDAEDRKRQQEQADMVAKLTGLKIKDAESDLLKQETDRKRATDLQEAMRTYYGGGQTTPMPAPQSAAATMQGLVSGQGMPAMPEVPQAASPRVSAYEKRMAEAEYLRSKGFGPEAAAAEEAALKLRPKVSNWKEVREGGKVLYAPYFDDGTSGQPVPLEVAEKLEKINRGGSTEMVNPYTGASVTSYTNSVSPDAALSAATQRRGQDITVRGQNLTNARELDRIGIQSKTAKAPTEFQGKSAIFGARAQEADRIVTGLHGKYDPAAINSKAAVEDTWLVGGALGAGVNKFALSANDQKAEQAQRDFINAVLRQESGAAIAPSEFDNARRQYFPQPGDTKALIEQKERNRKLAVQGLKRNAGLAAFDPPAPAAAGGWSITKVN